MQKNSIKRHITDHKQQQPKRLIQEEINTKILDDIANEAENKSKVRHWMERRENIKIGERPTYMDKLTRKQCNVSAHNKDKLQKGQGKKHYISILLNDAGNTRTCPTALLKSRN